MLSSFRPTARREGFLVQPVDGELLLIDGELTHLLNKTAASVWQLCDGRHSVADLTRTLALDEQTIAYALQQLDRQRLLENELPISFPNLTRREFLKRGAIAVAVVPVVKTIMLPTVAQAASGCLPPLSACTSNAQCCSGVCVDTPSNIGECSFH